jgi:4'-phosphopantetheinyl transferase
MSVELAPMSQLCAMESRNSLISLASGEIHLWLAFYDELDDPALHAAYRRLLNAQELEQEPRFYFARDRLRYLVTRALVRTVLSRYAQVQPSDWIFSSNEYGRPEIANAQVDRNLSFNISHTHALIVLGVTCSGALGVDVENIAERAVSIDIADRYFSRHEVVALNAVPAAHQQRRFFEYWTFKEAYIKARGMGLSLPLDKFSFHYPSDDRVGLSIDPELKDDAGRWRVWQFSPRPEYLVAMCAERMRDCASSVVIRQIVPMIGESRLEPKFLRVSE